MSTPSDQNEPYDLSKLYQHGARERPPEAIDRAILELAKGSEDQLSITEKQRVSHAMLSTWSRITSVAAVMVLSIYLFFDMRQEVQFDPLLNESYDRQLDDVTRPAAAPVSKGSVSNQLELEEREPQSLQPMEGVSKQFEQGVPAMFEQKKAEVQLKAKKERQSKHKNAIQKRALERQRIEVPARPSLAPSSSAKMSVFDDAEWAHDSADQIQESTAQIQENTTSTEVAAAKETAALMDSRLVDLQTIRRLLAEGKREAAIRLLEEFIQKNPDYLLPKDLLLERGQNRLKD